MTASNERMRHRVIWAAAKLARTQPGTWVPIDLQDPRIRDKARHPSAVNDTPRHFFTQTGRAARFVNDFNLRGRQEDGSLYRACHIGTLVHLSWTPDGSEIEPLYNPPPETAPHRKAGHVPKGRWLYTWKVQGIFPNAVCTVEVEAPDRTTAETLAQKQWADKGLEGAERVNWTHVSKRHDIPVA